MSRQKNQEIDNFIRRQMVNLSKLISKPTVILNHASNTLQKPGMRVSGAQNPPYAPRKKVGSRKFTTIPCGANIANGHIESHIFSKFVPVRTALCMLGFKFFDIFSAF